MKRNHLKTWPLAAAVALVCGSGAMAQDGLDDPAIERDRETRDDVAVLDRDDVRRDAEERALDAEERAERQQELLASADEALDRLRSEEDNVGSLIDRSYGHAVFDTTKGGLIVTGAGGTGVARTTEGGDATYMHLGAAGIGLGAGLENYQLVLLIEDRQTYDEFVSGQWDGSVSAQASAGDEGAAAEEQFVDGVRVYRFTDAGLMAQVDIAGMRFWPSEELNDATAAD